MADEILEEVPTEGTTEGTQTEDTTTGNGYLTKPYLVKNLQNFWGKIKAYITDKIKDFATEEYVDGAVGGKADKTDLASKIDQTTLDSALSNKVDKVEGKGLSENDFTNVFRDKLHILPTDVATYSNMGFMSGTDKQNLDGLVDTAVTEVDNELNSDSENPVQNKVITAALSGKADAETLDPLEVFKNDLMQVESSAGNIIFRSKNQNLKHFKLHTENGEIIEKFYISGTSSSGGTETFDTLKSNDFEIIIPNPNGENKPAGATYKFYVECLEFSNSGKYKPFILKVVRSNSNPINLILSVFKSQ